MTDEVVPGQDGPAAEVRIRSSAWLFAAQVGKAFITLPTGIILARVLGRAGKGEVTVIMTTVGLAMVVMDLGMPQAILWLAAKGKAGARGVVSLAASFAAAAVVLAGIIVAAASPSAVARLLDVRTVGLLALGVLAMVPSMVERFADSYLVGRGVIRSISLTNVVSLLIQLAAVAALALSGALSPWTAVLAWLAAIAFGTVWKVRLALRADTGTPAGAVALWGKGRAYAVRAWLGNTVNLLSLRQDVLLLAAMAGTGAVGVYSIAVTGAELSWYIPRALESVASAKFAAEKDSAELARRLNRSVWPFTMAFGAFTLAVGAPLIPVVYGPSFRGAVLPLALLLPGIVATSMSSALGAWLIGRGHPGEIAKANLVNVVVNVAVNAVLIPSYGAAGAAIASTLSYTAGSALIVARYRRRAGGGLRECLVPSVLDLRTMAGIMVGAVRARGRKPGA